MATLPAIVNALESDDALHLGRLLILVDTFSGKNGDQEIVGLTKLAKLDFLLRYPAYLERALRARGANEAASKVQEYERNSVEATMVRFRFGPWDHRYRRLLNTLAAKGLITVNDERRTVLIGQTEKGRLAAQRLVSKEEFGMLRLRSTLLKRHLDLSATTLMEFIYDTFPEISSMRMGEAISQ
jgi:hypothetical protein